MPSSELIVNVNKFVSGDLIAPIHLIDIKSFSFKLLDKKLFVSIESKFIFKSILLNCGGSKNQTLL